MSSPARRPHARFSAGMSAGARATAERVARFRPAFRAWEWLRAMSFPRGPATDEAGAPIPGRYLRMLVIGHADHASFLETGRRATAEFERMLNAHGASFAQARSVLDFGCGCGRLARHVIAMTQGRVTGFDYNPRLIAWCAANLDGHFARNDLAPPLPADEGSFDAGYALSVFTHLRSETQGAWVDELARVTAPGATLLITFHDEHQPRIEPDFAARVVAEGQAARIEALEGTNLFSAYLSHERAREVFGRRFDVLAIEPSDATAVGQAIAVLRRP